MQMRKSGTYHFQCTFQQLPASNARHRVPDHPFQTPQRRPVPACKAGNTTTAPGLATAKDDQTRSTCPRIAIAFKILIAYISPISSSEEPGTLLFLRTSGSAPVLPIPQRLAISRATPSSPRFQGILFAAFLPAKEQNPDAIFASDCSGRELASQGRNCRR